MEPIPTYLRDRIVRAVLDGATMAEAARRFDVSHTVVAKFVRLDEAGDSLEPRPHAGGPDTARNPEDRKRLHKSVEDHPDATLAEFATMCELDVSISTVCRELAGLRLPRKRRIPRASEQSEEETREARRKWSRETSGIDPEHLVFVDETGIATNMTRPYGRAPANQPVYTDVPFRAYESMTVLGGSGEFPTMVYSGGTTTDRMVEYVTGPLAEVLQSGDIVVADRHGE